MANFNASNTTESAWRLFYERWNYRQESIPSIKSKPQVRDFSFAEDVLYGRVDTRLNTVYPKEERMKVISSDSNVENSFRLLDFAADAFEKVKSAMASARDNGTIPSNSVIFSNFNIKKAYEDPADLYNNYMNTLMDKYIFEYLSDQNNKKNVFKFVDFLNHFLIFLKKQKKHTPVTFTSWQRSKTSSIFSSGIAIDIGGLEFGEDPITEERVLKNPCFNYYLNVCKQNGFLVSHLSPTLMVADILSPGLEPYANQNGLYTTESIFARCYNYTYTIDYEILQNKLVDNYNLFVGNYPIERVVSSKCMKTTTSKIIERTPVSLHGAQQDIPVSSWLAMYANIRNIEEGFALGNKMYNKLIKQIKTTKNLDSVQSMRYINDTFRETYKRKYGGLNYFIKRDQRKQQQRGSSPHAASSDLDSADTTAYTSSPSGGSSGDY
jgi:hypothetical protein